MRSTLYRATDVETDGRTLLGRAFTWNKPTPVTDFGGKPYLEEFARASADETLRRNPDPRPVFKFHGHVRGDDPIGVVDFTPASSGLLWRARLSNTRDADEALALVKDGAMTDASVGFRSIRDRKRPSVEGVVTTRLEIALRELSLAPTGFGQVPEGKVLAVRASHPLANKPRMLRHAFEYADRYGEWPGWAGPRIERERDAKQRCEEIMQRLRIF